MFFDTSTGPVGAHTLILANASPVLAAMLASAFREGENKFIAVKESSGTVVSFLLELTYSGTTTVEVEPSIALEALDLAHRWQVHFVVEMLERSLHSMLSDDTFESIAEAAQLKGLQRLMTSCMAFAAKSEKIQKALKRNRLPSPILKLLGKFDAGEAPQAKKRRAL